MNFRSWPEKRIVFRPGAEFVFGSAVVKAVRGYQTDAAAGRMAASLLSTCARSPAHLTKLNRSMERSLKFDRSGVRFAASAFQWSALSFPALAIMEPGLTVLTNLNSWFS